MQSCTHKNLARSLILLSPTFLMKGNVNGKNNRFTPTYNRANTLHRVYESLVAQTYRQFNWIIVDDVSLFD